MESQATEVPEIPGLDSGDLSQGLPSMMADDFQRLDHDSFIKAYLYYQNAREFSRMARHGKIAQRGTLQIR